MPHAELPDGRRKERAELSVQGQGCRADPREDRRCQLGWRTLGSMAPAVTLPTVRKVRKGSLPRSSCSGRGKGPTLAFRHTNPPAGAWTPMRCCCHHQIVPSAHSLRAIGKARQPRYQAAWCHASLVHTLGAQCKAQRSPLGKNPSHEVCSRPCFEIPEPGVAKGLGEQVRGVEGSLC